MEAVGAYLREIREGKGKSAVAIAEAIGTSQTHIWRIEQGKTQSIKAEMLFSFVQSIGADVGDVEELLLNPSATSSDGKRLARRRLFDAVHETTAPYNIMVSDDDVLVAIDYILKLRHDRTRMEKLLDFGKQLLDEKA